MARVWSAKVLAGLAPQVRRNTAQGNALGFIRERYYCPERAEEFLAPFQGAIFFWPMTQGVALGYKPSALSAPRAEC